MTEEDNTDLSVNDTVQPEDNQVETEQHQEEDDIEARARRMGWVDEDNFRGPKHRWTPADEYVRRAEEELPVLRSQLRRYDDDNARYERANAKLESELKAMRDDFKAFHEHSQKAEERAYQRAKSEYEAMMDKAVSEADEETYQFAKQKLKQTDDEYRSTQQQREPEQQQDPGQPNISPTLQSWVSENAWFNTSMMLQGAMIEANGDVMREQPHLSESERLAEAKTRVARMFPDRFPNERPAQTQEQNNARRNAPAAVSRPGANGRSTSKRQRTFDDLPDDAKAEYTRFAQRIPGYSKEDYVKSYAW